MFCASSGVGEVGAGWHVRAKGGNLALYLCQRARNLKVLQLLPHLPGRRAEVSTHRDALMMHCQQVVGSGRVRSSRWPSTLSCISTLIVPSALLSVSREQPSARKSMLPLRVTTVAMVGFSSSTKGAKRAELAFIM